VDASSITNTRSTNSGIVATVVRISRSSLNAGTTTAMVEPSITGTTSHSDSAHSPGEHYGLHNSHDPTHNYLVAVASIFFVEEPKE